MSGKECPQNRLWFLKKSLAFAVVLVVFFVAVSMPLAAQAGGCSEALSKLLSQVKGLRKQTWTPRDLNFANITRLDLSESSMNAIKGGAEYNYVVSDAEVFLSPHSEAAQFKDGEIAIARYGSGASETESRAVNESGTIAWNSDKQKFELKPTYSAKDFSDEERKVIEQQIGKGEKIETEGGNLLETRILKCRDIRAGQMGGKSFVIDPLVMSNVMTVLGIATSNPGRFTDSQNYDLLLNEFIGGNVNSAFKSTIGKNLVLGGASYPVRLASRYATGFVSSEGQKYIAKIILKDHSAQAGAQAGKSSEERARKMATFNQLWLIPSLVKSDWIDNTILKTLPDKAYQACLNSSPMSIVYSPRMIRFIEGWASTTIYFKLRKATIGE